MEPEILYKYRPFNENTIKILLSERLYFSSRKNFNDPLDSSACYQSSLTEYEMLLAWDSTVSKLNYGTGDTSVAGMQEDLERYCNEYLDGIGILSMSADYASPLMWSHYADNHKGVCLGFRRDREFEVNDFYSPPLTQVVYGGSRTININNFLEDRYPDKDFMRQLVMPALLAKAPNWFYEHEWRYLHDYANVESEIPADLEEVIFGWRVSDHVKETVFRLLLGFTEVQYYQMEFHTESFEMEKVPIELD
mgnify:CR=1 FL=1